MKIEWTGDLDDDCKATSGNYTAHCEALFHAKIDGQKDTFWYAAVAHKDKPVYIFHSGDCGGSFCGGHLARAVCEEIMWLANERDKLKGAKNDGEG